MVAFLVFGRLLHVASALAPGESRGSSTSCLLTFMAAQRRVGRYAPFL